LFDEADPHDLIAALIPTFWLRAAIVHKIVGSDIVEQNGGRVTVIRI
jgi:bifunctional ADP-heptose synthase (sugar kinase/adenylyltransferase)